MNKVFDALLGEKIEQFRIAFSKSSNAIFVDEETGRLRHPGEFGTYRENVCKDFIRSFIPGRLDIGSGFIMTSKGDVSTQCDVVIYDKNVTPLIQNGEMQRFFPCETVCAIGEVKSVLNQTTLIEASKKLARIKALRESNINPTPITLHRDKSLSGKAYSPIQMPYDHIFSFIICDKLDFNIQSKVGSVFNKYEPEIPYHLRHNLILSINDGLFAYADWNKKTLMYPFINGTKLQNRFVKPDKDPDLPFIFFAAYIFMATNSATILYPEMVDYMRPTIGGINIDG